MNYTDIRDDFPQVRTMQKLYNLHYFDSAATSLKPRDVIDWSANFYKYLNANVWRGDYDLSIETTQKYNEARQEVADLLGMKSADEIIFVRNTTEALNLAAFSFAKTFLKKGDEIVVTIDNHHSNLLPWQQVAKQYQLKIKFLKCDRNYHFKKTDIEKTIGRNCRLLAVSAASNVFGKNKECDLLCMRAREVGAKIVLDAAQDMSFDIMQRFQPDFIAFSGHKYYGPMGIGVLAGRKELLEEMSPVFYGFEMVDDVSLYAMEIAELPRKFEAGTPNVAGVIGLMVGLDYYLQHKKIIVYNLLYLSALLEDRLTDMPHLNLLHHDERIFCFTIDDVHPHDVAAILNSNGFAVRSGYLCAQPLLDYVNDGPVTRISLGPYNTPREIDTLCDILGKVRKTMGL